MRYILCLLTIITLLQGGSFAEDKSVILKELDLIKGEIEKNNSDRRLILNEISTIEQDRAKLTQAIIETADKARGFETRLANSELKLVTLEINERNIKKSLDKKQDNMVEILAILQRMGFKPTPALLASPEDAMQAVRSALLLSSVLPDMKKEAEVLISELAELAKIRRDIQAETLIWQGDLARLAQERTRIDSLIEARKEAIKSQEQKLVEEKLKAAGLSSRSQNLEGLLAKLDEAVANSGLGNDKKELLASLNTQGRLTPSLPFIAQQGKLRLPVNGQKLRDFGLNIGSNIPEKGMSYATPSKALITSPVDASVVFAGAFRSYGQLLILNAGEGYNIVMAGMEKINVEVGQFVLTGEPLGQMGQQNNLNALSSLKTNQPVLYIEFKKDGLSINPSPWWATQQANRVN